MGLEQKVQQIIGLRKKVQLILESRTKSRTTTSIFTKKYNLHFQVTFQISPHKWTSKSYSQFKTYFFIMSHLGMWSCEKSMTRVKKVKMTMCNFHVSLIKGLYSFFNLICPENMKHLSFIIVNQRPEQYFRGNCDIKVKISQQYTVPMADGYAL